MVIFQFCSYKTWCCDGVSLVFVGFSTPFGVVNVPIRGPKADGYSYIVTLTHCYTVTLLQVPLVRSGKPGVKLQLTEMMWSQ